ncbi:uncharacterized protein TrAFT101_004634 [Trichoderma asperellum]|uniref:uncharacterized protein n=1 Tax=Trichoderma asperellum TaxID=101201 RepID=UPI003323B425|nr:hypothetical protein TrAFT101_004634 [Trichoderma asperellum]
MTSSIIDVDYRGRIAVVSINNSKKLNVLSQQQYFELASRMREIATHDEVFVTVITAKGRYFSAGFDVGSNPPCPRERTRYGYTGFSTFLHSISTLPMLSPPTQRSWL